METTETRQTVLVITHLPDETSAREMAERLIREALAACVNIHPPCRSIYRWKGVIEDASEIPLSIKTTADRYPALEAAIRASHPYELPDILAIPVAYGLPDYLGWIAAQTAVQTPP